MSKIKYIGLVIFITCIGSVWGQTVAVPDANFLGYLKSTYPSTINAQDELMLAEAANIVGELKCYDIDISSAEGIQYFTGLDGINISNNNLSTLPDISSLTNLKSLDISQNELTQLPDLSSLTALEYLNAENNAISSTIDLSSNTYLRRIDLDYNELTEFPDLNGLSNLYHVDLDNNYLTFEDILPYTSWPDFDHDFDVKPQKVFQVAYDVAIAEGDNLVLATGIDTDLDNVEYDWSFNGNYFRKTDDDTLVVPNINMFYNGVFTCHLEHPAFPDLKLDVNNYKITVTPCMEVADISISTQPITCFESGKVFIDYSQLPPANYLFTITGLLSEKTFTSNNGVFEGLTEKEYSLKISSDQACMQDYDSVVFLEKSECEEIIITPNGDGYEDNYYFDFKGTIVIYDKNGRVVQSLKGPTFWDGLLENDAMANGYYVAKMMDKDTYINITVIH